MQNSALNFFVDRSRATIFFLILVMIYGFIAYINIPKESNPDVQVPTVGIAINYPGISPEDAERLVAKPIENSLRGIEGIKEIVTYAIEGRVDIAIKFDAGFNKDKAVQDVRNKVRDVRNKLPRDIEEASVREINLSFIPVLNIIIRGDIPDRQLLKYARDLKEDIEGIRNVLEAYISSDREEVLEIILKPHLLQAYGLSTQDVSSIIDSNNKLVAAGSLKTRSGELSIKVPSLIEDLESLLNFPVKSSKGKVVKLRDIAEVRKTFKDPIKTDFVNGSPAIGISVVKRIGANIIETVEQVKQVVKKHQLVLPSSLEIIYTQDQSDEIKDMISELENTLIIGIILVMIVIIIAVGIRSAVIIALSFPASFLAGILVLSFMDVTLNIVVLFSLILTVGMIVDDAIVVSEYADRKMIEGNSPKHAYLTAAKRMFWPIITSTLVKILVFLPLLFWPGITGKFMKYMPITVIAILASSLLFALCFQPAIGPLFGSPNRVDADDIKAVEASEKGNLKYLKGLSRYYAELLVKVLEHPKRFVIYIISFLFAVYLVFTYLGPGIEFFPNIEPTTATITIQAPGNYSLEQKTIMVKEIENKILDLVGEVKIFYTTVGNFRNYRSVPQGTIGRIQIDFEDWKKRKKATEIIAEIEKRIKGTPGLTIQVLAERQGAASLKPISFNLFSVDPRKLNKASNEVMQFMANIGGMKNIDHSYSEDGIELHLVTDRVLAARHLIDVQTVGNAVRLLTNGFIISRYKPHDSNDEVDVVLRFPEEYRKFSEIANLKVITREGKAVPISNFVKINIAKKVGQLMRVDQNRVVVIEADVMDGILADTKVKQIKDWLQKNLAQGVSFEMKGDAGDQEESKRFLISAFGTALILMFITMLIQFNNYYQTLVVMSAVFLSTIGVLLGLIITYQPFGIVMCGVGVIALSGIVLNNNILYVDTYQKLRKEGFDIRSSIIMSGIQRMRPILLTALTAILGLIPMVLGLTINIYDREISYNAPSSQWWRQLSASIAGGLSFATILTLFFTPCLLLIGKKFDNLGPETKKADNL